MNAYFVHKGNGYRFNVEVSKREDGFIGPPVETEFKGHKLKLKGIQEKMAYYEVKNELLEN